MILLIQRGEKTHKREKLIVIQGLLYQS